MPSQSQFELPPDVVAFRNDAAAYCTFIDALRAGPVPKQYTQLLGLLSSLAKTGFSLSYHFDEVPMEMERDARISHDQWSTIASEIGAAITPIVNDLIQHAVEIHGPDDETVGRASMLFDDLADIYRDLKEGLVLFDDGDRGAIAKSIWQWRFGYEQHWGEHLFRALQTVHEIRFWIVEE